MKYDFGKVDDIIGFDEYIEGKLSEKQKVIDEQQATIERLEKEDKRLNQVMIDLHNDIRSYNRKVKKQHMIINIQWDIIASLMELKGVIDDE